MSAPAAPLRVVIADDSPVARALARHALEAEGRMVVVAEAFDGVDALRQVASAQPDVLVLDLEMPRLDGLEVIRRQLLARPLPILVLSALPDRGERPRALRALELGALDLMTKPAEWTHAHDRELCMRVRTVARVGPPPQRRTPAPAARAPFVTAARPRVVAIGASTGGPPLVAQLLRELPVACAASVLVVQHIDDGFVSSFAAWVALEAGRPVGVAASGEQLEPGALRIAPGGRNLLVSPDGTLLLQRPGPRAVHTPSIDALLTSLADGFGARAAGVILSGMGDDGAVGLRRLRDAGGTTLVLDPAEALAPGMPQAAIAANAAGAVLTFSDLSRALAVLLGAATGPTTR